MNGKTHIRLAVLASLLILLVASAAGAQQRAPVGPATEVPTVTLKEAIDLALRHYPSIVQAKTQLDIAHSAQRVALASWLPTASLSSSVSKSPTTRYNTVTGQTVQAFTFRFNPVTNKLDTLVTPYNGSIGINANLVVWDWGARLLEGRRTGANAASADANLVSQKFAVTLLTKQAFFGALQQAELERVQQTAVQRAQEQLKVTREKLAAGSAVRSDTLSATVTLGQAQLQLLTAQTSRATQEATLARLIGFDQPVRPVSDSSVIAIVEIDTSTIRSEALQNSPAVAAAEASRRASQAAVNSARVIYLPTINAGYSNSRNGAAVNVAGAMSYGSLIPTWGLSVSLSWPLFNGLRREQTLWNAAANRDAAEATAADAGRNVNAQVTQYLAALQAALTRVRIARASRGAADEALRVQRERYRLGAATIVDVLGTERDLAQAEVDGVNARVDYQIAKANLSALVGREL